MRIRALVLLCFCLTTTLATVVRADPNFVINGNFSSPALTGNGYNTYALGATGITGWNVISGVNDPGAGSVDLISEGNYPPDPTAPPGSQIVDLDGSYGYTAHPAGGIQQVIMGLTPGNEYTLSFFTQITGQHRVLVQAAGLRSMI